MAHHIHGAPLLTIFFFKTSNGAPGDSAPLLVLTSNGTPHTLCATTNNFFYFFFKTSNGAPGDSAPLLVKTSNGTPQPWCATTNIFFQN